MIAHASLGQHVALTLLALAGTVMYGRRWYTDHSTMMRLSCWTTGVVVLMVSLTPRIETVAQRSFAGHMVQHVLMISVAAPLLVLARPVSTVVPLRTLPANFRRFTHATSRRWHRCVAPLAPTLFTVVLVVTHLTGLYDAALRQQWVHDIEHIAYLAAGCAMWSLMLAPGRRRGPDRVVGVFGVIVGMAFLGAILLTADRPLVDTYAEQHGAAGALSDQRTAASIMWVTGMLMTAPLLIVTVWRWAALEQSATERRETLETSRRATPQPDSMP